LFKTFVFLSTVHLITLLGNSLCIIASHKMQGLWNIAPRQLQCATYNYDNIAGCSKWVFPSKTSGQIAGCRIEVLQETLTQGSGTYGLRARCGSFDDGIWLAWYFLTPLLRMQFSVIFHLPDQAVSNTMQHQWRTQKIFIGGFHSVTYGSFVFGVRCLW